MVVAQVSEAQLMTIWFCCLAWVNSPLPNEAKLEILEKALMSKALDSNAILPLVQTGLIEFDNAVLDYAQQIEARLRAIDLSSISTGSAVFDNAFKERIERLISSNFTNIEVV